MKCYLKSMVQFTCVAIASMSLNAIAADNNAKTLLYISLNDYNYSAHLFSPYEGYWFEQGPLIEPIALKALQEKDASVALCTANEAADRVIRIKPNVFYNPQVNLYYSKLVATVFSGKGDVLGTYVGKAKKHGYSSLAIGATFHLNQVYTLAMQDLMSKINAIPVLENTKPETNLPCSLIAGQNDPKISYY